MNFEANFRQKNDDLFRTEALNAPQTSIMGYYFPYSPALRAYDHSSFNPALSDFAVSLHEIETLMQEVNSVKTPKTTSIRKRLIYLLLIPVIFYCGILLAFGCISHGVGTFASLSRLLAGDTSHLLLDHPSGRLGHLRRMPGQHTGRFTAEKN